MFQERLRSDVRGSIRLLRNAPVQSLLIIAVLSLGIGASLAVFAAVNLAFLRPLPFPNGDQLVIAGMSERTTERRQDTGESNGEPHFRQLEPVGQLVAAGGDAAASAVSRWRFIRTLKRTGVVKYADVCAGAAAAAGKLIGPEQRTHRLGCRVDVRADMAGARPRGAPAAGNRWSDRTECAGPARCWPSRNLPRESV